MNAPPPLPHTHTRNSLSIKSPPQILATGAFATAGNSAKDSPEHTHFAPDEMRACIEEADRRGIPVMAHAHGADGILMAAEAGCKSVEHGSFIDSRGIAACLRHGTFIVPTFLVGEWFSALASQGDQAAQSRLIELQQRTNERFFACIRAAVAAGVRVALGSDFFGASVCAMLSNCARTMQPRRLKFTLGISHSVYNGWRLVQAGRPKSMHASSP
jgi:imidazolonepropionase-like amidohydrolase